MKKFLNCILIYVGIVALFLGLMFIAYSLPDTNIRGHVNESIEQLEQEGVGYTPFFKQPGAMLDTRTDALILNIALNKGMNSEETTLQKAVNNSFYETQDSKGVTALKENILDSTLNNKGYSRYWHGIQIIIRPLLMFFNYMEIRYILMMGILILLGIVYSMISKQIGTKIGVALSIAMAMMYINLISCSIQYSAIFIVTLVSIIVVLELYKHNKEKFLPVTFFLIGAFSTFFDLLTYPLITFAFPMILIVILENRKGNELYKQILLMIKLGLIWSLGYAGVFFAKWLVASIILHKNEISVALDQILFRVNGNEEHPTSRIGTVKKNFDFFFIPTARYILLGIFVIWLILVSLCRKNIKQCKHIITLMIIAVSPYVWYIVFSGHSGIHTWFTNKIQAITIFAILCAMFEAVEIEKVKKYLHLK